jgi:hypothetical protein
MLKCQRQKSGERKAFVYRIDASWHRHHVLCNRTTSRHWRTVWLAAGMLADFLNEQLTRNFRTTAFLRRTLTRKDGDDYILGDGLLRV